MSDLCVHQFEDTVWNDFCLSEDIMVFPGSQQFDDHTNYSSLKKRRRQNSDNSNSYGDEGDDWSFQPVSKKWDIMSENYSWSQLQSELFPSANDNTDANLSSVNSTSSPHAFEIDDMEKDERIMNHTGDAADNKSFSYSLDDVTDPNDNVEYFECKDSSDLLCYGWPEIGIFDDVFTMFRSCDSTFGAGSSKEFEPIFCNFGGSEELVNSSLECLDSEANIANGLLQSSLSFAGSDKIHSSSVAEIGPEKPGLRSVNHDFNPGSPCENVTTKGDPIQKKRPFSVFEPGHVSSSNTQQNLATNPSLDDISFEATSFHHLQHAMLKLDSKTKLCIRDSLYRLSWNAEQRHNSVKSNLSYEDDKSASFLPYEATSCLMSIETDTNPVDRSIAHLLFDRPLSSSALDNTSLTMNPPSKNRGSYVST